MLGLTKDNVAVQPKLAYIAYQVGATFAGAQLVESDDPAWWPSNNKLISLNSPGNPDGSVVPAARLWQAVERARELSGVILNDEHYAEMGWEAPCDDCISCILDPEVTGGDNTKILAIYSLSKQSNLAGYWAAFAAGDQSLIAKLVNLRMHSGMMPAMPVQKAITAGRADHEHVATQKIPIESAGIYFFLRLWNMVLRLKIRKLICICEQANTNTAGGQLNNSPKLDSLEYRLPMG